MSSQTLSLNCLACHILAKHRLLAQVNNHTSIKHNKYPIIQAHAKTKITFNEPIVIGKPTSENPLRKIA